MIEHSDPTDRDDASEPAEGDGRPPANDDLAGDELARDPDGEAVVVPGQRPGPTEPLPKL